MSNDDLRHATLAKAFGPTVATRSTPPAMPRGMVQDDHSAGWDRAQESLGRPGHEVLFQSDTLWVASFRTNNPAEASCPADAAIYAVTEGTVAIGNRDGSWSLSRGDVLVLPSGFEGRVTCSGPAAWFAVNVPERSPSDGRAGALRVNPGVTLSPTPLPPAEIMLSPMPDCAGATVFHDEPARLKVGVWRSSPYARRVVPHRVHEFMLLLYGEVRLTLGTGERREVKAGEAVFIPKGVPCGWVSHVDVKKIYIVQDPA